MSFRKTLWKSKIPSLALMAIMLTSSLGGFLTLATNDTLAQTPGDDGNPLTPDRILMSIDFSSYLIGDAPTEFYLQKFGASPSFTAQMSNGDMMGRISKTGSDHMNAILSLPLVNKYTLSWDMAISEWRGGSSMYLFLRDGSQYNMPVSNQGWIQWFKGAWPAENLDYVGFHVYGATGMNSQLIRMGEMYHYAIDIDNIEHTLTFRVSNDTTYGRSFTTSFRGSAEHLTHALLNTMGSQNNLTLDLDNILISAPKRLVDTYPGIDVSGRMMLMTFDDGSDTILANGLPIFQSAGMTADVAVISSKVRATNTSSYLTWEELQILLDAGWGIASHSVTHRDLTSLTQEEAEYEIRESKRVIEEHLPGYTVRRICAPYDTWNSALESYARSIGYEITPYSSVRWNVYNSITPESVERRLWQVHNGIGTVSHPLSHSITDSPGEFSITPDMLAWFLDLGVPSLSTDDYLDLKAAQGSFEPSGVTQDNITLKLTTDQGGIMVGLDVGGLDIPNPAVSVGNAKVTPDTVRDELIWWAEPGEYVIHSSTIYVWDGGGTSNLASEPANWRMDVEGVISNDIAPITGSNIRFDDISAKTCIWDLDYPTFLPYSITVSDGYEGTLIQGDVDLGVGEGGCRIEGGQVSFNRNHSTYCKGDIDWRGGVISYNIWNLIMCGDDARITGFPPINLRTLHIMGHIAIDSGIIVCSNGWKVDEGASFTIDGTFYQCSQGEEPPYHVENLGTVSGAGLYIVSLRDYDILANFGNVDVATIVKTQELSRSSRVVTFTNDAHFNDTLTILSEHPIHWCALDLNGHALTAKKVIEEHGGKITGLFISTPQNATLKYGELFTYWPELHDQATLTILEYPSEWLHWDPQLMEFSGTANLPGTFNIVLLAALPYGTEYQNITITVSASSPVDPNVPDSQSIPGLLLILLIASAVAICALTVAIFMRRR